MRSFLLCLLLLTLCLHLSLVFGEDEDILVIVGSSLTTKSSGSVVQFFDMMVLDTATGVEFARESLYQERNAGRTNYLTCTASDFHSHSLYFFASMLNTTHLAMFNVTVSHPHGWQSNVTFALSEGLEQSFDSICQCTRYSGEPEEHGYNPKVWANVARGPLFAVDVTSGDEEEIADLQQQGQACCVQALDLENLFFYSVHSYTLLTMDLSNGRQDEQPLEKGWYLIDVPPTQTKAAPRLITVLDGGYFPQLVDVDALDVKSQKVLYSFGTQYWPLYPGLHRSLMTDTKYYVALQDLTVSTSTKYDIYVFDTVHYNLQSRFEVDFPSDTYLIGMM